MVEIPAHFFETHYEVKQYPGVARGLMSGANCQHFCYEVLRHFGFEIGPLRSSNLWEDSEFTKIVDSPQALDLVLFNRDSDPFGAHVGVFVGESEILHLSKKIGKPVIWQSHDFLQLEEYRVLIGFKRPIKRVKLWA